MKIIKQIIPATQKLYVEVGDHNPPRCYKVHAWALTIEDTVLIPMVTDQGGVGLILASDRFTTGYNLRENKND